MKPSSPRLTRRTFSLACASAVLSACASTGTKPNGESVAAAPNNTSATPPATLPPAATTRERPIRVALALGGGAARGFAHIGVI